MIMKNITSLIIILLISIGFGYGQSTLSAGDIAITGFNSDNPDQFTFVLLTDILATTQIKFTDNGWQTSTTSFRTGEGTLIWTATTDLNCGTEITITDNNPFVASLGSITDDNFFDLSTTGDQILAYQGANTTPTFLYAINFNNPGWNNATNASNSGIPSGLTNTVNSISIGDTDNARYNCSVTNNQSLILTAVSTAANWTLSATTLVLGNCSYSCTPCPTTTTFTAGTWDNGIPDLTTATIINDNYNTTTFGSFTTCSLTVNPSYTLTVNDGNYIEIENDVINNGTISLQPTGSFIQKNDAATFTNSVNDNSFVLKLTAPINAWYEYTYWSSPVVGEQIQDVFWQTNTDRRYWFNAENFLDETMETANNNATTIGQDDVDDNNNDWQLAAATDVLQPGVGYAATLSPASFVFAGGTYQHTFSGPFNNGVFNVPVYRNDAETADINWNFIGNPYPSAIDIDLFFTENVYDISTNPTGALDGAIYLWSQNAVPANTNNGNSNLNFASSDYAMVNGAGEVAGGDGLLPNRFIPSGQGFFTSYHNTGNVISSVVNGDGDLISTGEVTFRNAMRTTGNNNQFFRTSSNSGMNANNKLWLNLTSDNGVFSQILVGYVNGATNDNDGAYYDATRNISTGMSAFMYSTINGSNKNYAIQGKAPESLNLDEVIPLGIYTTINIPTLYKISIEQFEGSFFNSNTIYLKDYEMNTIHNLSSSDYNFTSSVGDFNNRFEIIFNENSLSTSSFDLNENTISIIELENDNVKFLVANDLTIKWIKIYDVLGRALYVFKGSENVEAYNLSNLNQSIYIAQVELSNGAIISKKAIKK